MGHSRTEQDRDKSKAPSASSLLVLERKVNVWLPCFATSLTSKIEPSQKANIWLEPRDINATVFTEKLACVQYGSVRNASHKQIVIFQYPKEEWDRVFVSKMK